MVIGLGQRVTVKLAEAEAVTGGLIVELIKLEGQAVQRGPSGGRGKPPRRKMGSSRKKAAKTARKVKRTRT